MKKIEVSIINEAFIQTNSITFVLSSEYNVNDRSIILLIDLEYIAMNYFNIYALDISDSLDLP